MTPEIDTSTREAALSLLADYRPEVGSLLGSDQYTVVVVRDERDIVGAALVEELDDEYAILHALAVRQTHRRQGYARRLVEKTDQLVESHTLEAKCACSLPANEFYEATGWSHARVTGDAEMNVWHYSA